MMQLMTMKETLVYLKIKRTTFYNYKKQGMPIHYVNGNNGRPYCYKEEIDQWLKDRGSEHDTIC